MDLQLTGIHHLTAITAQPSANLRFYTDALGMRLVKKTVNQDDTTAYHLFYGDGRATPGSDITFFDWSMQRERRGGRSIVRTSLRVRGAEALAWWLKHLSAVGVSPSEIAERMGYLSIDFEDPEGQRLRLVSEGGGGSGDAHPWAKSPVPPEHQIRGLGPITISTPDLSETGPVLTEVLNMRHIRAYAGKGGAGDTHVFAMGEGGPAAELHVIVEDSPPAMQGAGGVHHVAFRTPDVEQLRAWISRLSAAGLRNSGEVERYYFTSLYFREPSGVLFEIATDGPGFDVDEPMDALGERLALPPFLEPQRALIEANLKPLT